MSLPEIKADCRFFIGEKPCQPYRECHDCSDYAPVGTRILIIKLGAGGDVLRTACLLPGLKSAYPSSHITWITQQSWLDLLSHHPHIDRLLPADFEASLVLTAECFDLLINLDKVPSTLALARHIHAAVKLGFTMDHRGALRPLNPEATYAYALGLSDRLKFKENRKTYPEIIYEICRLPFRREQYLIYLDAQQKNQAASIREKLGAPEKFIIGLNTGSGSVFATKRMNSNRWIELATRLYDDLPSTIALLGGPEEHDKNNFMLKHSPVPLVDTGTENTLEEFISLVAALDVMVTGDTLAMHIAIALHKKVVVLLGPTSEMEIDLFDHGRKIVTEFDCAPCYRKDCDRAPTCMDALPLEQVVSAVGQLLTR